MKEMPDQPLRIFVIWEPVLLTDWSPPTTGVLSRLHDGRAAQFWDRGLLVSQQMRQAAISNEWRGFAEVIKSERPVWDTIAIYAKGPRWDSAFPEPMFADRPVVQVMEEFRRHLHEALAK